MAIRFWLCLNPKSFLAVGIQYAGEAVCLLVILELSIDKVPDLGSLFKFQNANVDFFLQKY